MLDIVMLKKLNLSSKFTDKYVICGANIWPQRICYSHWANGSRNGVIYIGQWGVFNHKKEPSDSPIWQLKKRELLLPLSFLITKPIKLDLSNLHYGPHYKPH